MHPYRVEFPQSGLDDLRRRLSATRWPDEVAGAGWTRGVPVDYLRELTEYWRDGFDWRVVEARLNAHPQAIAEVDGTNVHFVHVRSPEPDAVPLLITHGWPGSVLEFLDVLGPLTNPRSHGAIGARAFHVVLPTVPGFGLSGPTNQAGWDAVRVGRAWAELMRRLGYDRYLVQGGDLGSFISLATAAVDAEHVAGVQLTFLVTAPSGPSDLAGLAPRDMARVGRLQEFFQQGSGYLQVQATRPQTIAYALTDSPVGQLAWAVEKYAEWSACVDRPEEVISRDDILANVTLTWLTATAGSSAQFYYEIAPQLLGSPTPPPPLAAPLGVSVYPADPAPPVRSLAERVYPGIAQWREHDTGGHFPQLEQPAAFVADLREFAETVASPVREVAR
jgi:pimeloyl-ACP methyl ester carboxylesterase